MRRTFIWFLLATISFAQGQLVTWTPYFATASDSVTVIFDATQGNAGLKGYTGDVYAHTGVITNLSTSSTDWKYVKTAWAVNTAETKLTRIGTDLYQYSIKPSIRSFYAVPVAEQVLQVAFVFRNTTGTITGKTTAGGDIFVPVSTGGSFSVAISQPITRPIILAVGEQLPIQITAASTDSIYLYIDNIRVKSDTAKLMDYIYTASTAGKKWIKAVGTKSGQTKTDSLFFVVRPPVTVAALPANADDGINYGATPTSVTLVLYAPNKSYIYAIGDFSNWDALPEYYMNKTPDGNKWWVTINNISVGLEYGFQYLVDGSLRIADPYCDKVLDPNNDQYIASTTYPNLKAYPKGKTTEIVGVFQTAQSAYNWTASGYVKPPKDNLVIYELLIRDFSTAHTYQSIIDTLTYLKNLGVNAIELMPVFEFEGNLSWGYNPAFYFAPDKYYGTKNDFKKFVDICHQNGIAVIMDMVLNHSMGSSPFARLYWNAATSKPAADNPWFNVDAKHPYNVGNDFNHESAATQYLVDRVTKYWITDYKIDGYRFDLSKGFTQNYTTDVGVWGQYDQSRINLIERMAGKIWAVDPYSYVILEHFADNSEEKVLANYGMGMLLWGNSNSNYNEATMGYNESGKSDISWMSWKNRGWNSANVVGYMESHDEERLMYKNITFGNLSGTYSIKTTTTALERMKLAGAFFFTIPGPKMIWQFGELGYDLSHFYPCGTDVCKTDAKPIKWDYYADATRLKLYKTWAELNKLKKTYPAFRTSDFSMDVSGAMKRISLNNASMNVAIIGNFGVTAASMSASFQSTGKWYNYFAGDSITVSDVAAQISLNPGEFRIYTNVKLPTPEAGLVANVSDSKISGTTPNAFELEQNYPNPFNPSTVIKYSVPYSTHVKLNVYDALGNLVANLVDGNKETGSYQVEFDLNKFSSRISSGVYFYSLESNSFRSSRKMLYLK